MTDRKDSSRLPPSHPVFLPFTSGLASGPPRLHIRLRLHIWPSHPVFLSILTSGFDFAFTSGLPLAFPIRLRLRLSLPSHPGFLAFDCHPLAFTCRISNTALLYTKRCPSPLHPAPPLTDSSWLLPVSFLAFACHRHSLLLTPLQIWHFQRETLTESETYYLAFDCQFLDFAYYLFAFTCYRFAFTISTSSNTVSPLLVAGSPC
jgi:hypothetical protein